MTGGRHAARSEVAMRASATEAAEAAVRSLLAERAAGATICPSEAARRTAGVEGDWRERMPDVHRAVDNLHREGAIALSWKGKPLTVREGPYRIGLPE